VLKGETNTSDASDKYIAEVSDNIYSSIHAASDAIRNIEQNQKTKVITLICHKSLSTLSGAIMGVGSTRRLSAVRWGIGKRIVYAWLITIPASAAISSIVIIIIQVAFR
jgi:Phosphate transporter family